MKLTLLDRYIGKQVLLSVIFTLLVLMGLRTLFTLLDESGKIGQGSYSFLDALYYAIYLMPSRIYEFFPMSVLIGGLSALGVLAGQNELTVMRAAGIKTIRIVGSALKATVLLMVMVFVVGEWIAPQLSQAAIQSRASALSADKISRNDSGIWARSQNDIVHIKNIIHQNHLSGVTVFRMNEDSTLAFVMSADKVVYEKNVWVFYEATQRIPTDNGIEEKQLSTYSWQGDLNPNHVEVLTTDPEMLNLAGLSEYRQYLDKNALDSRRYQLEFWRKIVQPLTLIVMIILASSFIFGPMRSTSMGARLMTGIVVGFAFYLVNNFFGPMSLIYQLPPILGAVLPMLSFAVLSILLLKRAS